MRTIQASQIRDAIASMFQRSAVEMTDDMQEALQSGSQNESQPLAKQTLLRILENAEKKNMLYFLSFYKGCNQTA